MDRLQFHSLLKDELIYEVSIRSETPSKTVDGLRKQMRQLLPECPPEDILVTELSAGSELDIIAEKVTELGSCIDKYISTKDKYSASRSKALGNHLYYRLIRVQAEGEVASLTKADLAAQLETLFSKLESLGQSSSTVGSVENIQAVTFNSQPTSNKEVKVVCSGNQNVAKWNLKFDTTTDPRSFLERVDELKVAYGVSDEALFCSAAQLFSGNTLLWFRGVKSQVSSWKELKDILLLEFSAVDYDYRLLGEIRSRTQGSDEEVHIYFAVMSCMFSRLRKPLSEEEKLEILRRNVRPNYAEKLALIDITSVQNLKDYCRKLEEARQRTDLFVEPSQSSSKALSSDFVYKPKARQVHSVNFSAQKQPVFDSGRKQSASNSNKQFSRSNNVSQHSGAKSTYVQPTAKVPVCFKCGGTNHVFKFCKNTAKNTQLQCFGCGKIGVKIANCQKCQSDKVRSDTKSKNL